MTRVVERDEESGCRGVGGMVECFEELGVRR